MTDADLRGRLLKGFYDRRHNANGWVPTSDMDAAGGEFVDRQVIGGVCGQLAEAGLIQWKPLTGGQEGFVIGMAKITATGVDVIDGARPPPIAINIPGQPPRGIDAYNMLLADAKKLGPDEAELVDVVGRARAEPLLAEAIKRQQTASSFVTDSHGVNRIPRNFFDLIEADLRRIGVAVRLPSVPDQSPAPVRVEERHGRISRVSDRDSPLGSAERDFNGWREPILDHVQELLSGDFRQGTNHSRARERLVALGDLLPGSIAEVKERQFRIGYEIERLEGLVAAYRSGADDMPVLSAAVLEDLDRLRIALALGISKLERWAEFRRLAAVDPMHEGSANPVAIGAALIDMAVEMERQPKYFDPELPETFRFLAEATKDPQGATKAVVYGAVRSAENVVSFLGQRALAVGIKAVGAVEQHISAAVATSLFAGLSAVALEISGALPAGWAWLKPLLDALAKASGGK
jgi:hypothetical protein